MLRTEGNLLISLVATGLVAVVFAPLRHRLQKTVNRLMYGERNDPYAVLSRLGQRLESTLVPEAALRTVVETIAQALKLPYAAINLEQDGEYATAAEYGTPVSEPVVLPLTYGAEQTGQLVLAPRAPGRYSLFRTGGCWTTWRDRPGRRFTPCSSPPTCNGRGSTW